MKICKNCGREILEDDGVCKNCGAKVSDDDFLQNDQNLRKEKTSSFRRFKTNLRMLLSEFKAMVILLVIVIICGFAIYYFASQLVIFAGEESITNTCILSLVFWAVVGLVSFVLLVFSVVFNIKEYEYFQNKNKISSQTSEKQDEKNEAGNAGGVSDNLKGGNKSHSADAGEPKKTLADADEQKENSAGDKEILTTEGEVSQNEILQKSQDNKN